MNQPQLPAYLQNNRAPRVAERSMEGMGGLMPPHISIRGNEFTLIDGSGSQRPVETKHLDVCIIDVSDHMNKLYYGKDYQPDSNDPPMCFSANGVAPSSQASQPQSPNCAQCPQNVRGSAVSKLTGSPIKACRDEKWLAVLVPGVDIVFQFRVTPGSFTNYREFAAKFKGQQFDAADCLTRLQFQKDSMGVVTFQPVGWIDETLATFRGKAFQNKATDLIVGRTDEPIAALPAPVNPAQVTAPQAPQASPGASTPPFAAPPAEPPKTRRGRPAKAAEAPQQPNGSTPAPFRPEAPPNVAPPFGVAASAPPPPQNVAADVHSFFSKSE